MALLKCKMCGGDLQIATGVSVTECEYCGTRQTVPKADDEKKITLFARAGRLRAACEFDKAAGIYESIVADFPEEAEAYWGLVLCKYGIEYVDDPATGKKIPTCHRSSFESVMEDSDFEQAAENADGIARRVYREEAKTIESLRKGIIAVSANEQPYDIFICYKETAENGERTLDSVLAQDIYDALTEKGYRVFFSRISLEDKLGQEYEPYIFAALNSAKIMLTFGTDYDYFNAVWVKNEWGRFLKLMAKDKTKHLIPCYKGIDAYDLPKEFAKLQAQDLGKVGATQDLLRGIEKLLPRQAQSVEETVVMQPPVSGANTATLLKRAFMFLEDGNWASADEYCEKVLDIDPECAQAYLGKLMVELKVKKQESLKDCPESFAQNGNYQKALRFGDEKLKKALSGYIDFINARNQKAKLEWAYQAVLHNMVQAQSIQQYTQAAHQFEQLGKYKDSEQRGNACREKAAELQREQKRKAEADRIAAAKRAEEDRLKRKRGKKAAAILLASFAVVIAIMILLFTVILPASEYSKAVALMDAGQYEAAIAAFEAMDGYKDSAEKVTACQESILQGHYNEAIALMEAGQYNSAIVALEKLDGYKDSAEQIEICREHIFRTLYDEAVALMEAGNTAKAAMRFGALGDYQDAKAQSARLWEQIADRKTVSASSDHTVGLKADGTVVAVGYNNEGQCDVSGWTDIVAVVADSWYTVGLKADGTVVAVGYNENGQCDVSDWTDIVAIAAGGNHTVGLKSDGTVVAAGNNDDGQCYVDGWTDIVAIAADCFWITDDTTGYMHLGRITVGLKADGTVVAEGNLAYDLSDVSDWTDIVAISASNGHIMGLKADGTVIAAGRNEYGQCDVSSWTDIVAIAPGGHHTVGLKSDGTVVTVGYNEYGQCDVSGWKDIVAIAPGGYHTLGLKADGTIVAVGHNNDGQCNVDDWTNIKVPE